VVMLSSGGEAPRKVADNADRKKSSVTTANRPVSPTPQARPEEGGGLLDRPRGPIEITAAPARQAVGLEEIVDGVVKIETPGLTGMAQGTGFIINDKGWIATNCHVISDATDQTRVIIRNSEYKVAGLIIKAEEHDMAIIKLAEQPFQLTVLDISYSQHPKLASKVRAIGFPDNTFNLTEGIVSNVATLAELTNDRQRVFLRSMQAAPSHLWIQHSAKISPGNSGGPLLNEENQVIGINTWVSTNIDAGYAGHINHLRDLIARASDTVTPFPKGIGVEVASTDDLFNTVFTADRVRQLVDFCDKFQWKPTTEDEFDAMAELAKLITLAKVAPPGRLPGDIGQATDVACQKLANMTWDADQIHKINAFAAEATNKPLHGNFFVATMVEPNAKLGDNARVDRMRLEGNDCRVIVQAQDRKSIAAKDARVLIVGLNSPILVTGGENTAERVILPGFHRELK
jgi:S1-C subfamily serine protease